VLDVRVGFLTSNIIAQFDEVLSELAKTADDQSDILPPDTVRHQFGMHPVTWIPGVEFFGVLHDVPLNLRRPLLHWHVPLRDGLQLYELPATVERVRWLAGGVSEQSSIMSGIMP